MELLSSSLAVLATTTLTVPLLAVLLRAMEHSLCVLALAPNSRLESLDAAVLRVASLPPLPRPPLPEQSTLLLLPILPAVELPLAVSPPTQLVLRTKATELASSSSAPLAIATLIAHLHAVLLRATALSLFAQDQELNSRLESLDAAVLASAPFLCNGRV